jgi:hypothetical protein
MRLSPNDWRVHAGSTRDLADRMLVRGDTKGAEAMLKAAAELEKRSSAAIADVRASSLRQDRRVIIPSPMTVPGPSKAFAAWRPRTKPLGLPAVTAPSLQAP